MTEPACASCGRALDAADRRRPISAALCKRCLDMMAAEADPTKCCEIMRGIDAPVLLMQPNPRLVYAASDGIQFQLIGNVPKKNFQNTREIR